MLRADLPLVLHVLPIDLHRGAQTYARELRVRLDGAGACHRTLSCFSSPVAALQPDVSLGVRPGALRRAGLDPRVVRRLRRVLREVQPAALVAHGGESLKYLVLAGADPARVAYYKIGANDGRLRGARRLLHRLTLRRAGVVAVVSNTAGDEALALGVPPKHLHVIPNGRDPAAYRPGEPGTRAMCRLVWVAHLDATKRPGWFVDVVRGLRERGVAVEAAIAGSGPLLDEIAPRAAAAGVELLGTVMDVPTLLSSSDVFVFTGAPPEGMPGVLIEAGMSGLPVVTTDVPGATDVVVDRETGFVVGVENRGALESATLALVEDPVMRARMGAAARRRCVERFSLDASIAAWHEVLSQMVENSARPVSH